MMNETIVKFGYPATLIRDYAHWLVLLRPQQPTLGSLVLAAKSEARAFADLPPEAFGELASVTRDVESTLRAAVRYDKINYLMLMMVDPFVHFHALPRYEGEREGAGLTIPDAGWPKLPALNEAVTLDEAQVASVSEWLKGYLP
jgi:diadenosine tetraphosphate (Ap4A) HIT family hydrolase